ncbi:hypothetical protein NA78x_001688 [Anatilimnocola sp. NA78]|uniref:hypothetical protein n=1 Tax=Anatilimnocola sp. NA78 TaxID=3415683 RepID=UPI003CE5A873
MTLFLLPLAGCRGCWSSNANGKKLTAEEEQAEKEKKKKKLAEKPKMDFDVPPTIILPNESGQELEENPDAPNKQSSPKVVFFTKPGHWIAAIQPAKANNFDFQGELRTFAMDQNEDPLDVEHTDFRLSILRPASLPKGQQKRFETMFYLPKRGNLLSKSYSLRTELRATRTSRLPEMVNVAGNSLLEHEYYMVVLAKNNSSYVDLTKLDSVQLQDTDLAGSFEDRRINKFYQVVLPRVDKSVPLPKHPLAWTMIAYIVWDDVDPTVLTAEQQAAMLDWLHWGGQLIVSGPNSLDRLKQTFLEPYLPAESGKALEIGNDQLKEINEHWSVPTTSKNLRKPTTIQVQEGKPLVGVELLKHAEAEWLPNTGELVIERRIGQGRIVATAFPLSAFPFRYWASRDNFFNAVLLRRPARSFAVDSNGLGDLHVRWHGPMMPARVDDPRLATTLRYFSRDIGHGNVTPSASLPSNPIDPLTNAPGPRRNRRFPQPPGPPLPPLPADPAIVPPVVGFATDEQLRQAEIDRLERERARNVNIAPGGIADYRFAGYQSDQLSGVGGWNDFSGAAEAAVAALNDASGIKIPRSEFVIQTLAVYLLVLVPLNWFFFWLIGRVEYAWVAAPIIAVIGAVSVVRLAQLDIGFARSRTEIALLESHAGYPRAHVTRFTALYTSLSTNYDLRFEDPNALALPLALGANHQRHITRNADDVALTQDETIELSDVYVNSNSTGKVHVEQMIPLDAAFQVTGNEDKGWQLENGSQFLLRHAGILRRRADGEIETAYFPDIQPGATVKLNFAKQQSPWVPQWNNSAMMSTDATPDDENRVRLHRLSELAAKQLQLLPGDMRLVAWTDDNIPGLQIRPAAAQSTTFTLVLVHLKSAALPEPASDANLRIEVKQDEVQSEDEKEASS